MDDPMYYEIKIYNENGDEILIPSFEIASTESDYGILEAEEIE
jgi:hypothetical protein